MKRKSRYRIPYGRGKTPLHIVADTMRGLLAGLSISPHLVMTIASNENYCLRFNVWLGAGCLVIFFIGLILHMIWAGVRDIISLSVHMVRCLYPTIQVEIQIHVVFVFFVCVGNCGGYTRVLWRL